MPGPRFFVPLFWLTTLFTFVMAILPHPPVLPGAPTDKMQHIAAFVVLTVLAAAAYPGMSWRRAAWMLPAFGAFIEIVQAIPALHRTSDIRDWTADTVAVLVTLGIIALLRAFFWKDAAPAAR